MLKSDLESVLRKDKWKYRRECVAGWRRDWKGKSRGKRNERDGVVNLASALLDTD